uniref:LAGLIDADG endonuclease n=1 Tax=Trametes coccinea TaxID=158605 RepID=A0A7S9A2I3_TRACO|nr:LAGLIDADG endonuclease [Trametes coccinea]QPF23656.1 LAGLIDADG endonuclease [Trametes coccinea]
MKTLRIDFSEMETRKFSITPYWVLGFVEGEGSFTVAKRDYTLLFILTQSAKDLRLMEEVQNFFLSLCNDTPTAGKYVNKGVRLYRETKSNADAVYVSIGREDIITKIIIPFFDSLSWHSKKEKDYQDWKIILRLKQLGLHFTDEGIRVINLILNQMNLKRLSSSNSVKVDKEFLNKTIVNLLNGPSNIETHEYGRIFVKSLNIYFNLAARDKIKV